MAPAIRPALAHTDPVRVAEGFRRHHRIDHGRQKYLTGKFARHAVTGLQGKPRRHIAACLFAGHEQQRFRAAIMLAIPAQAIERFVSAVDNHRKLVAGRPAVIGLHDHRAAFCKRARDRKFRAIAARLQAGFQKRTAAQIKYDGRLAAQARTFISAHGKLGREAPTAFDILPVRVHLIRSRCTTLSSASHLQNLKFILLFGEKRSSMPK